MDKIHLYDKILSQMVTKKSTILSEQNKIVFKVNVTKINIINKQNRTKVTRGKKVKVSGFKKAIITLKKGQSIDLTTGI
jgi:large subunit ribosomal protein L23